MDPAPHPTTLALPFPGPGVNGVLNQTPGHVFPRRSKETCATQTYSTYLSEESPGCLDVYQVSGSPSTLRSLQIPKEGRGIGGRTKDPTLPSPAAGFQFLNEETTTAEVPTLD